MIISLLLIITTVQSASHHHRHCESNTLSDSLSALDCDSFVTPNECARQARRLVQSTHSGAWASIVVRNDQTIDISFNSIEPQPTACHVRSNNNDAWMIRVFRTGHRRKSIVNDQYGWIERQSIQLSNGLSTSMVDLCPLSFIRQLTATHNISSNLDADRWRQLITDEYGGRWNVLVARVDNDNQTNGRRLSDRLGFSFPHYVYDSKAGFCINKTPNGFYVNIAKIGYESSEEERDSIAR